MGSAERPASAGHKVHAAGGLGDARATSRHRAPRTWRRAITAASAIALLLTTSNSVTPASAQADRTLRIFPSPVTVDLDGSTIVGAWLCRTIEGDVFGTDGIPGTDDDRCRSVDAVRWSIEDRSVARVRPQRGASVEVVGRADGISTIEASHQASQTRSFVSRTSVVVSEPIEEPDPGVEPDVDERPIPGVDASLIVQPGFAALSPGDGQLFVAYLCPLVGADPRGLDQLPGTADDFCKPVDASWSLLGDPPLGTLDPTEGFYTILSTDEDTDLSSAGGSATTAQTTDGAGSGAVIGTAEGLESGASVALAPGTETDGPIVAGDADADGDVDGDDLDAWQAAYGTSEGQDGYDPGADFDQNGTVNANDFLIWQRSNASS